MEARRREHGPEHQLTLAAEARLAVTYIELAQADKARPLLVHVRQGLSVAKGADDPTVLAVTERLADAELAMGETARSSPPRGGDCPLRRAGETRCRPRASPSSWRGH